MKTDRKDSNVQRDRKVSTPVHQGVKKRASAEKKQSASRLSQRNTDLHRQYFESTREAVIILDADTGEIIDTNPSFCKLMAIPREELLEKIAWDLKLFSEIFSDEGEFKTLVKKKAMHFERLPLKTSNGRNLMVELSGFLKPTSDRNILQIHIRDTTSKVKKEEELQERAESFRSIFENTTMGLYRSTPDGHVLMANPTLIQMLGYTSYEDIAGIDLEQNGYVPEFSRDDFKQLLAKRGEIRGYESAMKKKDGSPFYSRESARIIRDENGKELYYEGTVEDITQRKLAEQELERQAQELRQSNQELARLYRASSALITDASVNQVEMAGKIVEIAAREFGQSNSCLFLAQEESQELSCLAAAGPYAHRVMMKELFKNDQELVPECFRKGELINIADFQTSSGHISTWREARSELSIPLKVGEKVIGVIDVHSHKPNAFSQDDERLMSTFSERAALALEHCRLYEQMEKRVTQLSGLRSIDKAISSSSDLHTTLEIILEQVVGQVGVHAAVILQLDTTANALSFMGERGFLLPPTKQQFRKPGEDPAWRAILERREITIPDVRVSHEVRGSIPYAEAEKFAAYSGLPLIARGQVKGVLEVFHREPLSLEKDARGFLELLAEQTAIAMDNAELFEHLQRTNAELALAYDNTLEGWVAALELRDKETEGHTRRVINKVLELARAMNINESDMAHIYRGALLHDIGKMGVPDGVVLKPGPLTEEEWSIMRLHPVYAYNMLSSIEYLRHALDIPFRHHEKWDGNGYPGGLKGEEIPLFARIFAVVDVWDALISDRRYRKAWKHEDALQYIKEQSGQHFDPAVVKAFLEITPSPLL